MSVLGQNILNAKQNGENVGIYGRLAFCYVANTKVLLLKLKDFLPYADIAISEDSEDKAIVSVDMYEVKLKYKFSLTKTDNGYHITKIEEI